MMRMGKFVLLSQKPEHSAETLATLAKDGYEWTRKVVAENLNTSPETLATLAKDESWYVRQGVSQKPERNPLALAV